jgi:uncharacterized membrane protein
MIVLLAGFVVYQVYRLTLSFSLGLTLLTLFDALVIVLTWREYQIRHGHRHPKPYPTDTP